MSTFKTISSKSYNIVFILFLPIMALLWTPLVAQDTTGIYIPSYKVVKLISNVRDSSRQVIGSFWYDSITNKLWFKATSKDYNLFLDTAAKPGVASKYYTDSSVHAASIGTHDHGFGTANNLAMWAITSSVQLTSLMTGNESPPPNRIWFTGSGGTGPYRAFDRDTTWNNSLKYWVGATIADSSNLGVTFQSPVCVKQYILVVARGTLADWTYTGPDRWQLQGSSDSIVWYSLETEQTGEWSLATKQRTTNLSNTNYYKYYRLRLLNDDENVTYISELYLYSGSGVSSFADFPLGTTGQVIKMYGGLPTWRPDTTSISNDYIENAGTGDIVIGLAKSGDALPVKRLKAGSGISLDSTNGNNIRINWLSSGTTNYIPKWTTSTVLGNTLWYEDGIYLRNGTDTLATMAWHRAHDQLGVSGGGIMSLRGLTASTQTLSNDINGIAPFWSTGGTDTHILNIPMASTGGVTAGLLSKTDYDKIGASYTLRHSQLHNIVSVSDHTFYGGSSGFLGPTGWELNTLLLGNFIQFGSISGIWGVAWNYPNGSFLGLSSTTFILAGTGTSIISSNLVSFACDITGSGSQLIVHDSLHARGNIRYDGTLWHGSNRKLKKDIDTIGVVGNKLLSLQPKSYKWDKVKYDTITHFGFIYDELKDVFPNLTKVVRDTIIDKDKNKVIEDREYVNTVEIIPLLVKAFKEHEQRIVALEDRIKLLEKK